MKTLKKVEFDLFIWNHFARFLSTPGNFVQLENGKSLKEGLEFKPLEIPTRINIVDQEVWKEVLLMHLKHYNYN
ncbi:MAG: hypothetical protein JWP12_1602 [Bacteroidetes bacterium]|nr:hypothetical protein [Bacteroidota bacterium]